MPKLTVRNRVGQTYHYDVQDFLCRMRPADFAEVREAKAKTEDKLGRRLSNPAFLLMLVDKFTADNYPIPNWEKQSA